MIWLFAIAGALTMGYGVWVNNPWIVVIGMAIMFFSLIFDLFGATAECEGNEEEK